MGVLMRVTPTATKAADVTAIAVRDGGPGTF